MAARAYTVAFSGTEARGVEVQAALSPGLPTFSVVGLPDKAVSEAKERIRAAFAALSIALPAKRITINLSPADTLKEGAHYDLPIALALLAANGILSESCVAEHMGIGELSLDGTLVPVAGALPAALYASEHNQTLLCPAASAREAAWVDAARVIGAASLGELLAHLTGRRIIGTAEPGEVTQNPDKPDLKDVKGQQRAKRALEIAAAGGHHLLMTGPPGSGKSMLAARLPSILPPLTPKEALEVSVILSLTGGMKAGAVCADPPFREPHHTASMAAIIGGGRFAQPGEISLAHNGVLFLDELPEFAKPVLETLRQPIENGEVVVARANHHVRYPCRFMLLAAANPCRCGYLNDPARRCNRAPVCGEDYMSRISGPVLDRFDLRVEVPAVPIAELSDASGETSQDIALRVIRARAVQLGRLENAGVSRNADLGGEKLSQIAAMEPAAKDLLQRAADRFGFSARGYHRVLRVARTIADLSLKDSGEASEITVQQMAEAISYRAPQGQ